jgi:RimJ/RimL family protein N-acetyltransferase
MSARPTLVTPRLRLRPWRKSDRAPFAGFVGLQVPGFEAHFTPGVEIGWRLAVALWGQGHATEAARAALDLAFGLLGLAEVVAYTVPANLPSRRVMGRLGMRHDAQGDFEHPHLPPGHPLHPHLLYRLRRADSRHPAPRHA